MIRPDDLGQIVGDKVYIEATESIARSLDLATRPDYFPAALKRISLECVRASGCSPQDLLDCLREDLDEIVGFSARKWRFLEAVEDDQDYPAGEEPGRDDGDEVLEVGPTTPAFLVGYLCEFYLLKYKGDGELMAYLKRLRIPGRGKYAKDLKRLFGET